MGMGMGISIDLIHPNPIPISISFTSPLQYSGGPNARALSEYSRMEYREVEYQILNKCGIVSTKRMVCIIVAYMPYPPCS